MTTPTTSGCPCADQLARIEAQLTEQNTLLQQLTDHVLGRTTTEYRAALLADLRRNTE